MASFKQKQGKKSKIYTIGDFTEAIAEGNERKKDRIEKVLRKQMGDKQFEWYAPTR